MSREKIDYGIDLGTTNSAIARIENGNIVIIKSEGYQKDTTPSCISFKSNGTVIVGDLAYNHLDSERKRAFIKNDNSIINTFEEFKRTMGTDKVYSAANMSKSFTSEELSSEILKALKSYVRDDVINSVVITVPAMFQGYQKDATLEASKLAGFAHCILLQEPIAASMAYGIDTINIDGDWLVFDFGGGTFDVALMRVSEGIMRVVETEGNNYLGGKNIDEKIVSDIIVPYLQKKYSIESVLKDKDRASQLLNALKREAEIMKIDFSTKIKSECNIQTVYPLGIDEKGNEIEIDLTVSIQDFEEIVKPVFQRAIDITKELLKKQSVSPDDLSTVLLVGGPTLSETFREMIREQITQNINISIDPMTVVAKGAALFASTKSIPENIRTIDKSKVQLKLIYSADTVETEEKLGIRILREKIEKDIPQKLYAEVSRIDKDWTSGKIEIESSQIFDLHLLSGKTNRFKIDIYDENGNYYEAEPNEFSIIQGFKTAGATLPFDICLDIYDISKARQQIVRIDGLGKNQLLPARGKGIYQTQKDIRPGNTKDIIRIPVYYGEDQTKAIYNLFRGEILIDGYKLPGLLPKGSDVELTIDINESEEIHVSVSFPYLDDFILEEVIVKDKQPTETKEELKKILDEHEEEISIFEKENTSSNNQDVTNFKKQLNEIGNELEKRGDDVDKRQDLRGRMQEIFKKIDKTKDKAAWPKAKQELLNAVNIMKKTQEEYGDEQTQVIVNDLLAKTETALEDQNVVTAKELIEQISLQNYRIIEKGVGKLPILISILKGFEEDFDIHDWKDVRKAKALIAQAKELLYTENVSESTLASIIGQLYDLLPSAKQPIIQVDDQLLTR